MTIAVLVAAGMADLVPVWSGSFRAAAAGTGRHDGDGENRPRMIRWDIAIDCRTWRFNGGVSFQDFGRGDSFIANGTIFPGDTLAPGSHNTDPSEPGGIGDWVERGTTAATLSEIAGGVRPAFFATWFHLLADGSAIVADGAHPESGPMAIVGGRGAFNGAAGELSDEIIGTNSTGCPNLRVTIRLKKPATS
jgi:hypothetical protein